MADFNAKSFSVAELFNNSYGKTSCTKTVGILAALICILMFVILMFFYMFNLEQADVVLQFVDKDITMFGFSLGLLGIKSLTSKIGGNTFTVASNEEEGQKSKKELNKFEKAIEDE